jgi:ParB/RepB/Spo0J family partition protein
MTTNTFATLPLAAITPSLTNPRKRFDAVKLAELAESIKASGVHQPILVRPLPGNRITNTDRAITHEIIAGERRYRACLSAGLETIPALVRELSDSQVLEAQIVENLQRDDLTELEEAEGYEALMAASQISAESVGSKIGKSRSYVYGRIKLLDLSVECKQALREGQLDASRALLIARIPDTTLQTKALAEATRKDYAGQVCSVRALQNWLLANVMLRLDKATFNPADSMLVIGVSNCHTCPKRTGANPDLFTDVQGADICTDPACYHDKEAAHRASVLATAAKRGMTLIEGEDAGHICSQYTTYLNGYSPLTQERADTTDGQPATLGQLLGSEHDGVVLIENPWTKELIAAVPTAEAEGVLLARGLVKSVQTKQKAASDIEDDIKRLQANAQKATTKLFRDMAFTELAGAVHGTPDDLAHKLVCGLLLRAWWLRQVEDMGNTNLAKVFGITLLKPEVKTTGELTDAQTTQMRLHVQACSQAKLFKALALWLVLDDNPSFFYGDEAAPTLYTALASEMGVDLDEVEEDATAQVRADTAAELRTLKAKLKGNDIAATGYRGPNGETWSGRGLMPRWLSVLVKDGQDKEAYRITPAAAKSAQPDTATPAPKVPTAQAPAAQAIGGGGRRGKTSAAEAKAQIAAAMQAQEGPDSGADAQGIDVDSIQPVAAVVADAPKASLSVDTRVMVTKDTERLPLTQHKFCGKVGTITQQIDGEDRWMVTFKGRTGGMCVFDAADLSEVAA